MPSAKRASMREGPLAALFRKTAEDTDDRGERQASPPAPPAKPESSAGAEKQSAPSAPPEPEVEEPRIPLPHERLRHAFSADIPENFLDRPAPSAPSEPVASEPEHDVYARATRDEPVSERARLVALVGHVDDGDAEPAERGAHVRDELAA